MIEIPQLKGKKVEPFTRSERYLKRISLNTSVIKWIVVLYFIGQIFGTLLALGL